jgi:hypothetical protein
MQAFQKLDCSTVQHMGVPERADLTIVKGKGSYGWNYTKALPIKEIHDRWISGYASKAIDLLARMKHGIENSNFY